MSEITIKTKKIVCAGIKRVPISFDEVFVFDKTLVGIVEDDGKYTLYFYKNDNMALLRYSYGVISYQKGEGFIAYEPFKNECYIFVDLIQKVIGPFSNAIVQKGHENVILASEDVDGTLKWGAFSKDGDCIIKVEYDNIYCGEKDYIFVEKDGKHGAFYYNGKDLIGPIFADCNMGEHVDTSDISVFTCDGKEGIIGGFGEKVLPAVFDNVEIYDNVPIVYLNIKGQKFYYHLNLSRFFDGNKVEIYPHAYTYYLDGSWHQQTRLSN